MTQQMGGLEIWKIGENEVFWNGVEE